MKKVTDSLKKVFGRFDDSLFNPPKENLSNKNFKGQTILRRKLSDGGPNLLQNKCYQELKFTNKNN